MVSHPTIRNVRENLRLDRQLAWPLIVNFSCQINATSCNRAENMGWRYLIFTLGGLTLVMWFVRFFVFRFHESPRYLIGKGRDEEAVEVVHKIAKFNGRADRCTLTVEDLQGPGGEKNRSASPSLLVLGTGGGGHASPRAEATDTERKKGLLSSSSHFSGSHIKALFLTKKMAWSTSLLILIWGIIGLASTLYNSFLPYMYAFPLMFPEIFLIYHAVCRNEGRCMEMDRCTRRTETYVVPLLDSSFHHQAVT